jgi:shikimate kinase
MSNIFLVGFMGSGKSTLGKKLAEALDMDFIDSDNWIEKKANKKIADIFADEGESQFRKLETEFIEFARSITNTVVATGAGLPCENDKMDQLKNAGVVIWLDVDEDILVQRLSGDPTSRPKLLSFPTIKEAVHSLLGIRRKFYEQANLQIKDPTIENLVQLVKNII